MQTPDSGGSAKQRTEAPPISDPRLPVLDSKLNDHGDHYEGPNEKRYPEDEVDKQIRIFGELVRAAFARATASDYVVMLTNIALIVVGVVAAFIYHGQLAEMRGTSGQTNQLLSLYEKQREQMIRQASATEKVAIAAQTSATQAVTQATQTTKLATDTHDLAVSAGQQAGAAKVQSQAAIDLASQTKTLASTAQQELSASQRPWMKVDVALNTATDKFSFPGQTSPIAFDSKGVLHVDVTIIARNVGRSPAMNVNAEATLIPSPDRPVVEAEQRRLCENASGVNSYNDPLLTSETVFPSDPYSLSLYLKLDDKVIQKELRVPSNHTYFSPLVGGLILRLGDDTEEAAMTSGLGEIPVPSSFVVGCLDYSVDYSGVRHQTPFFFDVYGTDLRGRRVVNPRLRRHDGIGNNAN